LEIRSSVFSMVSKPSSSGLAKGVIRLISSSPWRQATLPDLNISTRIAAIWALRPCGARTGRGTDC